MSKCALGVVAAILFVGSIAFAQSRSLIASQLQEADRRAWLTDWYGALSFYQQAEKEALRISDRRNAMYAKFGRVRGQMQTFSLTELSEQLAADLSSPITVADPRLRLRGLTVKGDVDLESDVLAAQRDWQQVAQLARDLGDKGWENRATGELALVAFLRGNTGQASTLIQQALQAATSSGDIGGQVRYMGAIANGLWLAGNPQLALGYADRALKLAKEHPETGFPFVVYSTRALALVALNEPDEAERFANAAMSEAQVGDRRIKEIELLMILGQIAQRRQQTDRLIDLYTKAATAARIGRVQRLLADAEANLADAYRALGDIVQARKHALAAVAETEGAGSRFTLPIRLGGLADIYAAEGNLVGADRAYEQATDVVEGIMVNVPSRDAQARLIGVMSDLYAGHFRLAADRLTNPVKAYGILERARGRALADVLRTISDSDEVPSSKAAARMRTISLLQTRLMRSQAASQRKQLLDELWDVERQMTDPAQRPRGESTAALRPASIRSLQQTLRPGELMLEYVLTEPRSYCLAISRSGLDLVPLPSKQDIEQRVDAFVAELRSHRTGTPDTASAVRDAVLGPMAVQLRKAQRLIVVPDGKLHMLPFDAIANGDGSERRIVTIAPSANVFYLLRMRRPPDESAQRPLFAVGGVPYDRMFTPAVVSARANRGDDERGLYDATYPTSLPLLATAQEEVLTAARTLGSSSVTITGDGATESAVKAAELSHFGIVHFAVHAVADPKFPERAALILLDDPAAGEDGLLQPREIARLRLNNAVVVLSACDTSVGPTIGQEGVQNLARAFLLAGAQSVVTTLWSVSDAVSMALMRSFYEHLAAGQDVAQALTEGKRAVLDRFGPDSLPTVSAFQVVGLGDHRVAGVRVPAKVTTQLVN